MKRKLSEAEKLQKLLNRFKGMLDNVVSLCERDLKAAKEDTKLKLETGKLQQLLTSAGILIDKIEKLAGQVQEIPAEDLILKFEEETAKLFYEWLKKNDEGYHKYLLMIKGKPELLKRILNINDKELEEFKKEGKIIPIEG